MMVTFSVVVACLLSLTTLLPFTFASPILDDGFLLEDRYAPGYEVFTMPGINWTLARETCNGWQYDVIVEVFRAGEEYFKYASRPYAAGQLDVNSAAFDWFFISPSNLPGMWKQNPSEKAHFEKGAREIAPKQGSQWNRLTADMT